MSNRAERRKKMKATPRFERLTVEQQRRAMGRNGITPEDMKREREAAYKEGYKDGVDSLYTAIYAGVCLAANELFGFGDNRCFRLISKADDIVLNRLTNAELTDEVYRRMKMRILQNEPFDRIEKTD